MNATSHTTATADQTLCIRRRLNADGFDADVITDVRGEPVATVVRNVFASSVVERIVAAATLRTGETLAPDARFGTVPYGTRSEMIYPASVCRLLDCTVSAALSNDDVASCKALASEAGRIQGVGDANAHTDFPANVDDPLPAELHGLNVHVTLEGEAEARFARLPDFEMVDFIAQQLQNQQKGTSTWHGPN